VLRQASSEQNPNRFSVIAEVVAPTPRLSRFVLRDQLTRARAGTVAV
jgi:hypothetical protein